MQHRWIKTWTESRSVECLAPLFCHLFSSNVSFKDTLQLNFNGKKCFKAKESCVLAAAFCVTYCRYWLWLVILFILFFFIRPCTELQCSLKNNRQPWEHTEWKDKMRHVRKLLSIYFFFFFLRILFSQAMSAIHRFPLAFFLFFFKLFLFNTK